MSSIRLGETHPLKAVCQLLLESEDRGETSDRAIQQLCHSFQEYFGQGHFITFEARLVRAICHIERKEYLQAEVELRQMQSTLESNVGIRPPIYDRFHKDVLFYLSYALYHQAQFLSARESIETLIDITKTGDFYCLIQSLQLVYIVLRAIGESLLAEEKIQEAIQMSKTLGDLPDYGIAIQMFRDFLIRQGREHDAEQLPITIH